MIQFFNYIPTEFFPSCPKKDILLCVPGIMAFLNVYWQAQVYAQSLILCLHLNFFWVINYYVKAKEATKIIGLTFLHMKVTIYGTHGIINYLVQTTGPQIRSANLLEHFLAWQSDPKRIKKLTSREKFTSFPTNGNTEIPCVS